MAVDVSAMCTRFLLGRHGNFRYRTLVNRCFPRDAEGNLEEHHVPDLTQYALQYGNKLHKIGRYLERMARRSLTRRRFKSVANVMKLFNRLIEACHDNLSLFENHAVSMVELLFAHAQQQRDSMRILAAETFITIIRYKDGVSDMPKFHVFVDELVGLCVDRTPDQDARHRLRHVGLRSIKILVQLYAGAETENHLGLIVQALLRNMRDSPPSAGTELGVSPPLYRGVSGHMQAATSSGDESIRAIACETLTQIARLANNQRFRLLLEALFGFLETHELWLPNDFALECMHLITQGTRYHENVLFSFLLKSLDRVHTLECTSIKTGIMKVISRVILMIRGEFLPWMMETLSSLLRHLQRSVEIHTKLQDDGDIAKQCKLQDAVIECIGSFARRVAPSSQVLDILVFILSRVPSPQTLEKSSLRVAFLQAVLAVSAYPFTTDQVTSYPVALTDSLLLQGSCKHPGACEVVMRIWHQLLTPPDEQSPDRTSAGLMSTTTQPQRKVHELLTNEQRRSLHTSIFQQTLMPDNRPANFCALFETLADLLYAFRNRELCSSIPMVARLQELAENRQGKLTMSHACALYTMVGAYLLLVGKVYDSIQLVEYAKGVIERRPVELREKCMLIVSSEGKLVASSLADASALPPIEEFFDMTEVVDILSKVELLRRDIESVREALAQGPRAEESRPPTPRAGEVLTFDPVGGPTIEWKKEMIDTTKDGDDTHTLRSASQASLPISISSTSGANPKEHEIVGLTCEAAAVASFMHMVEDVSEKAQKVSEDVQSILMASSGKEEDMGWDVDRESLTALMPRHGSSHTITPMHGGSVLPGIRASCW